MFQKISFAYESVRGYHKFMTDIYLSKLGLVTLYGKVVNMFLLTAKSTVFCLRAAFICT